MRTMRKILLSVSAGAVVLSITLFAQDEKVARGKYLADEVARCQDCHTPHLMGSGEPVKSAWLKGTQLDYVKIEPVPGWRSKTPDITSGGAIFANWGEDGVVKFLETGRNPRGNKAGPPMPPYNLSHEDAVAIAAYLKSLK